MEFIFKTLIIHQINSLSSVTGKNLVSFNKFIGRSENESLGFSITSRASGVGG
jgi:hypothetical protein